MILQTRNIQFDKDHNVSIFGFMEFVWENPKLVKV